MASLHAMFAFACSLLSSAYFTPAFRQDVPFNFYESASMTRRSSRKDCLAVPLAGSLHVLPVKRSQYTYAN